MWFGLLLSLILGFILFFFIYRVRILGNLKSNSLDVDFFFLIIDIILLFYLDKDFDLRKFIYFLNFFSWLFIILKLYFCC